MSDYNPINESRPELNASEAIDRRYRSWDSITGQAYADMVLAEYNYLLDDEWYQTHESAPAKAEEYAKLGINPLDINRMLLGNPSYDSGGSSASVSANGTEQVQAAAAVTSSINDTLRTNLDFEAQRAKIDNLYSQSALNFANAGMVNPIGESTIYKNYASGQKDYSGAAKDYSDIEVNEADIKLIGEKYNLTKEQTRYAEQLADSFPEMNKAELDNKRAQTSAFIADMQLKHSEIQQNEHENAAIDADRLVKEATVDKIGVERTGQVLVNQGQQLQNEGQQLQNERNEIALGLEKILGAPISADDNKIIQGYVERGDYAGLDNYLKGAFEFYGIKESKWNKFIPPSQMHSVGNNMIPRYHHYFNHINSNPKP